MTSFEDPYLQSVLDKIAQDEGFSEPKFSVSSGSKPGDNFACRISRVVITETSETEPPKTLSLIFKIAPVSKARQEKVSMKTLFKCEAIAYKSILPTLNKLLNKYGVVKSDVFPNTAKCFAANLDNEWCNLLVLEDKCTDGYRMIGEHKSLDEDHCRLVLRSLALWHASSLALKQLEPEEAERLRNELPKETIFDNPKNPLMDELKGSALEGLRQLQEPIKPGNVLYEKTNAIVQNYPEILVELNKAPTDLCCIIQGDCWFNNILYKYNKDEKIEEVCLIDHQIVRWASPVIDISYVLGLCTTKDVRDASYDKLLRYYYSEVTSHLRKMSCDPEKIIPWELLQEHLHKFGLTGIMFSLTGLHVVLADSSDININLHAEEDDGNVFAGRGKSTDPKKIEEISRRMTDIVTDLDRLGFLDAWSNWK